MTTLTISEQAVRTETEPRETLMQRAIRSRRLGGFVFDVFYTYELLKEKIIRTSAITLGGVGMTAFMTGMAEKANAAAETTTGQLVASIMDDPELLNPVVEAAEANSLIAAGAIAVVAAGVINMNRVGTFDPAEDCGLSVINPNRDLSQTYTPPPIERFDAWAEIKRHEFAAWCGATYANAREAFVAWRADIAARKAAQVDPNNYHYEPFAFTPNIIEDGPIFSRVDETAI